LQAAVKNSDRAKSERTDRQTGGIARLLRLAGLHAVDQVSAAAAALCKLSGSVPMRCQLLQSQRHHLSGSISSARQSIGVGRCRMLSIQAATSSEWYMDDSRS